MSPFSDLDRRIREALRIEPSAEQIERIERFWREQSTAARPRRPVRSRRVFAWAAAAVATTILVAVGLAIHGRRDAPHGRPVVRQEVSDTRRPATPTNPTNSAEQRQQAAAVAPSPVASSPAAAIAAGREPTAYERILFAARSCQPAATDLHPTFAEPSRVPADGRVAKADEKADRKPGGRTEHELAASDDEPRVEPPPSPEQLVGRIRAAGDPKRRAELLRQLLAANTEAAVRYYLALVGDPATRRDALAFAHDVPGPAIERLLGLLDDKERPVRLSAAMVLARADGPEVAAALVDLVRSPASSSAGETRRTEAWIALLACRDRSTDEFLAYASVQPRLLKHLNRARVEWQRMTLYSL